MMIALQGRPTTPSREPAEQSGQRSLFIDLDAELAALLSQA